MKKIFIAVFIIIAELKANAQEQKLARIAGGDSYLNIREGESSDSKIIGSLKAGDFFYVIPSDESWWQVQTKNNKQGFVYCKRVELLDSLSDYDLRNLFSNVFENEKEIAENYSLAFSKYNTAKKKWDTKTDSLNFKKAKTFLNNYSNEKYFPLTEIFAQHFCETNDTVLMKSFLTTLLIPFAAEREIPQVCLAECYKCNSTLIDNLLLQFSSSENIKLKSMLELLHQNNYPDDLDSVNKSN